MLVYYKAGGKFKSTAVVVRGIGFSEEGPTDVPEDQVGKYLCYDNFTLDKVVKVERVEKPVAKKRKRRKKKAY